MSKIINDDLFEGSKMTFGQHIEELRKVLIKSLFGVVIAFLVALYFAGPVVEFIQEPLKKALTKYYMAKAVAKLEGRLGGLSPEERKTILVDHLAPEEVRVDPYSVAAAYEFASPTEQDAAHKRFQLSMGELNELENVTKLAKLLHAANTEADAAYAGALMGLLKDRDKVIIEDLAQQDLATEEDRNQLLEVLNRVIDKPQLRETEPFQGLVDGSSDLKTMRDSLPEKDDEKFDQLSRRFNRLLVTQAFKEQLREPRVSLVNLIIWRKIDVELQSLSAHEAFMIWIKAAFVVALLLSSPWIFIQIWEFVAAGLYPHEKRYVYIYLPFSMALFLAGAALAFFFVFEPVLDFLFSFNKLMKIDPDPRIGEWISFVLTMPLGFGIAFQLPLVMLFLNRIGVIGIDVFLGKWRIAILVIFVLSMFLTPADPISMMLMAVPLTLLYFLGIALCQWMPRGHNPFDEAYEP